MLVSSVLLCISLNLCSFFLHSSCPLCFFRLHNLCQPLFLFAVFSSASSILHLSPVVIFLSCGYCIFNFRISFFFCNFFLILDILSLMRHHNTVPSFNSLGMMMSFDSLKVFVIVVLKSLQWSTFAAAAAKSLQSCSTLCDPIDGSPPGSPVPGILQARTLDLVAFPSPMCESEK